MPRMIDLIRASAVPVTLVQSAARGSLALPPQETLEILVYLATENKLFAEMAALTLAGWDETLCRAAISNPAAPAPVLAYFSAAENFRPALFEALLANHSVPDECLAALVASISREQANAALHSDRVIHSRKILTAFANNPNLNGIQSATIDERLSHSPEIAESPIDSAQLELSQEEREADEEVAKYIAAHTAEISAEADKPFQPVGGIDSLPSHELPDSAELSPPAPATAVMATAEALPLNGGAAAAVKTAPAVGLQTKGSALQRISKLDVKGRIQLAMKGTKEERALLVRDGTKIVALAVLDSPKISDSEVEKFATQKNVLEAVLRAIPLRRRFMKQYNVVRNLVFNPRTPIDVSLSLMKGIMVNDLKNLSGNKEVSDTVRKLALRMFKQKVTADK